MTKELIEVALLEVAIDLESDKELRGSWSGLRKGQRLYCKAGVAARYLTLLSPRLKLISSKHMVDSFEGEIKLLDESKEEKQVQELIPEETEQKTEEKPEQKAEEKKPKKSKKKKGYKSKEGQPSDRSMGTVSGEAKKGE